MTEIENTQELYEAISQMSNCSSINPDELRKNFAYDHNFLQNEVFFNLVLPLVKEMAEQDFVDARNKQAHNTAKELLEE
jgi:hypothetical protein